MIARKDLQFDEDALQRMDDEGGGARRVPGLAAVPPEAGDNSLPVDNMHTTAEMFSLYARLSRRWNAQAVLAAAALAGDPSLSVRG